ncbi:MAG: amino acid permease [Candidatus Aenigmarchaeota archaeon]|nr:amino acid permease [Candidatus Aenigmarchaeota archaeon]
MKRQPALKRSLGFWALMLCSIGAILGAGIYVLIGKAAALGGNAVWMSFGISALLAAFTGLSYAELVSMFPKSSAEYGYTKKAFGEKIGFIIGMLIILASVVSAATVAIGFAGYFSNMFPVAIIPVAIALIIVLSGVLIYGIRESAWMAIIFTLIEIVGLIIVIIIGIPYLGSVNYLDTSAGFSSIFAAAALIFFAYLGFEEIARLGEETKNPTKTIPKALIYSIIISAILYILVAVTSVSVVDWQTLGHSTAPLADVVAIAFGSNAFLLISVIALFATANTVLFIMLAGSRIIYGMSKEKAFPKKLSEILKNRKTPIYAILITMIFTIAFTLVGNIETIASLTDYAIFIVFIAINAAAIVLRYKLPTAKRPFKMPANIGKFPVIALLGIITSILMLLHLDIMIIIYGIIITLIIFAFYEVYEHHKKSSKRKIHIGSQ